MQNAALLHFEGFSDAFEPFANANCVAMQQSSILQAKEASAKEKYLAHDQSKHKYPYYGVVNCRVSPSIEFSLFHLNDDVVAWRYFWLGEYEPELMNLFMKHCNQGTRVLDIGAYSGCYSLAAAKCGATVDAFEMIPRSVERLKINIILNQLKNQIKTHAFGVSDRETIAEAFLPRAEDFFGTGNSLSRKSNVDSVASTPCKVRRMDDWWGEQDCPHVDLIKLDVEEHEVQALKGMQELIAQTKPTILIEVVKETYGEVSSMLEKHGYTLTQQAGSLNYFAEIK